MKKSDNSVNKTELKQLSTISIKSGVRKTYVSEKKQDVSYNHDWNESFSDDELTKVWLEFAGSIKDENKRLYSIIINYKPVIEQDNKLKILVINEMQIVELQKEKNKILSFLRSRLKNAKIDYDVYLNVEQNNNTEKVFTAVDKFKQMSEEYPALKDFAQKFDLDIK